jgi:hypothetical protein
VVVGVFIRRDDIEAAAAICGVAGSEIGERWRAGLLADEDDFTSQLIAHVVQQLDGQRFTGVTWRARKMTSRFEGSEESNTGADLLGVMEVQLPQISLRKGFLAQSKLRKRGQMARLRMQCQQMLEVTPDSFVFLYDASGVQVAPALLYATGSLGLRHVEPWSMREFFAAHLSCFIGDSKLSSVNRDRFAQLTQREIPSTALFVSARSEN